MSKPGAGGIGEENASAASRLIAEALRAHAVNPDEDAAKKDAKKELKPVYKCVICMDDFVEWKDVEDHQKQAHTEHPAVLLECNGCFVVERTMALMKEHPKKCKQAIEIVEKNNQIKAASKPATSKKRKIAQNIEFPLRAVNPHIVCKLCAGYFISATTIMECLHTFCKSCIVQYFHNSNHCPTCGVLVHETDPHGQLRQDRTIQSIVYKIIDNLQEAEEAREREFYKSQGLPMPNEVKKKEEDPQPVAKKTKKARMDDDQISFVLEMQTGSAAQEEEEENAKVTSLEKPYIRTSSKATILHLKKFLAKKLQLPRPEDVDILCRGEVLGKEYSLEYISRTRWRKEEQLVLKYRPRVDFQAT